MRIHIWFLILTTFCHAVSGQMQLPAVSIDSPADRATIFSSLFIANASASNAQRVRFYLDGKLVQTDDRPAYQWVADTRAIPNGPHNLKVQATNAAGQVADASVSFTVDYTPPVPSAMLTAAPVTVSIDNFAKGGVVSSSLVIVNAAASNATSVNFYMDGLLAKTVTHPAYQWVLVPGQYANGVHTVTAEAIGAGGVAKASLTFTLNVLSTVPVSPQSPPAPVIAAVNRRHTAGAQSISLVAPAFSP